jgi:hypothetical protein
MVTKHYLIIITILVGMFNHTTIKKAAVILLLVSGFSRQGLAQTPIVKSDTVHTKKDKVKPAFFVSAGMSEFFTTHIFLEHVVKAAVTPNSKYDLYQGQGTPTFTNKMNPLGYNLGGGLEWKHPRIDGISHIVKLGYTYYSGHFTYDSACSFGGAGKPSGSYNYTREFAMNTQYKQHVATAQYILQIGDDHILIDFGLGISMNFMSLSEQINEQFTYSAYSPISPYPGTYAVTDTSYNASKFFLFLDVPLMAGIAGRIKIKQTGFKVGLYGNYHLGQGYLSVSLLIDVFHIPPKFY